MNALVNSIIIPEWPAPSNINAVVSTRIGGVSRAPFNSLNLSYGVGDKTNDVNRNIELISKQTCFPSQPHWLQQIHSSKVVQLDTSTSLITEPIQGDASFTYEKNVICAVLTADCLPILISNSSGTVIAAIHAGWRGLAQGIIEATVRAMNCNTTQLFAWLGPAIGPQAFEVGNEVRLAFIQYDPASTYAFEKRSDEHWMANIYHLAKLRLLASGVSSVYGGDYCTFTDSERFYSYRRDGKTGRLGSFIWMSSEYDNI